MEAKGGDRGPGGACFGVACAAAGMIRTAGGEVGEAGLSKAEDEDRLDPALLKVNVGLEALANVGLEEGREDEEGEHTDASPGRTVVGGFGDGEAAPRVCVTLKCPLERRP